MAGINFFTQNSFIAISYVITGSLDAAFGTDVETGITDATS